MKGRYKRMRITKDSRLYFVNILDSPYKYKVREWRNQEFVRKNMIDSSIISEKQHEQYLYNLESNNNQKVFIAMIDEEPIAIMTFKYDKEEKVVVSGSYLVDEEYLGKGLGVLLGYVRLEYIFSQITDTRMRTVVMETNKKNLQLQKDFGCIIKRVEEITRSNGEKDNLVTLEMDPCGWEEHRERIKRVMSRLIPIENIIWIEEKLG